MKYPAYSQQPPAGWMESRLKFLVDLRNEKIDAQTSELDYVGLEHIESWTGRRLSNADAEAEGTASAFMPGDVLFGKLRPYLAKVHLAAASGMCSTEALVLISGADLNPRFLKYQLISQRFIDGVSGAAYGSKMPRANWEDIGNQWVLVPSLTEQEHIANFLDWKTGQIDALIAKKGQLLTRLKERRSTLISTAVTLGIDGPAHMRLTGSPWLPQVPQYWRFHKFGYRTFIVEGQVDPENEAFSALPLIAPNHMESGTGRLLDVSSAQEQGAISGKYPVAAGDIVYSKIRPHLNKCVIAEKDALCSADAYPNTVRLDDELAVRATL